MYRVVLSARMKGGALSVIKVLFSLWGKGWVEYTEREKRGRSGTRMDRPCLVMNEEREA